MTNRDESFSYKNTEGVLRDGNYSILVGRTRNFTCGAIQWECCESASDGRWTAKRNDEGKGLISEPTWEKLQVALEAFDPAMPRIDGIAIPNPLSLKGRTPIT